ncbi:FlgD immunoglobulin-like domain containing protein [Candidatus Eisenbacteria bacterium]|uniref:FlgD immunoglobulin-like domain containing protein n=1 Tax=Eiseniibacteriota bacterium TaxID=2212470 RepID=A0ABV6YNT6_UNCEI
MKRTVLFGIILAVLVMWMPARAADEAAIQAAIDDGLAWLALQQDLTVGPDYGSWGAEYEKVGKTGLAVKKFEHDAFLRGYENPFDVDYVYHEVVQRGLDYLFADASVFMIGVQPAGDPDTDGDGRGVALAGGETYETGIGLMAIAETNTPNRIVNAPGSPVDGWTYYDVAVDMVDYLAWSQVDAGVQRGAWGYDEYSLSSDNSNSGYAVLGLSFASTAPPHGFGITIPAFVKAELSLWIDYIQVDIVGGQFDGGSSCYSPADTFPTYQTVNCLETGNLIHEMAFYGDPVGTPRLDDAIDYLVRHWGDPGYSWPDPQGWYGNYQAMFTMMKGLEAYQIDLIGGIDWFDEVTDTIVGTQNIDGSWPADVWDNWVGGDQVLSTTWALLTLQKVTPVIEIAVDLDIKPTSCPNPLNTKSNGVLPIAILGTDDFDVSTIDPATVTLEGVPALRWAYEDVATPFGGDLCDCHELGPDGYMDMTFKFETQAIVTALGAVTDGEYRPLTLLGLTLDGVPIRGEDCVWIKHKVKDPVSPPVISVGSFTGEATTIQLSLAEATEVSIVVYDVRGKRVQTVVDGTLPSGYHKIPWNGTDEVGRPVSNGVYFCRVKAGSVEQTVKMLQLK